MVNKRLINCDFIKDMEVSSKAIFLYLMLFVNADDMGFVGNSNRIISILNDKEKIETNSALIPYSYDEALVELVNKGLLLEFQNKYDGRVYLIRHWFYHNKHLSSMETNYTTFFDLVDLVNGKYYLGEEKPLRERGTNKGKGKKGKEGNRKKEEKNNNNYSYNSYNSFECSSSSTDLEDDKPVPTRQELLDKLKEYDEQEQLNELENKDE